MGGVAQQENQLRVESNFGFRIGKIDPINELAINTSLAQRDCHRRMALNGSKKATNARVKTGREDVHFEKAHSKSRDTVHASAVQLDVHSCSDQIRGWKLALIEYGWH
jgi:hypothetical protein